MQASTIQDSTLSTKNPRFELIRREMIPAKTSMTVENKDTYLGELRLFKEHSYLAEFLPHELSIGWVKLPKDKVLEPHFHPCASMIIVTKGEGRSLGDSEINFQEGDIIHIPAWNLHGFQGSGDHGFEGLSIQFQENAIFESESRPETTFFDREQIPLEERLLKKVSRDEIESLNNVEIDGKEKNLGIVKNFRSNELLKNILPENFSAAWVHLDNGETLETHQHLEKSVILVTNGDGLALNSHEQINIKTGDGVFVPPHALHGFQGKGNGFWGLSIQFSGSSLYENSESPKVHFNTPFEKLLAFNQAKYNELDQLDIFKIEKNLFEEQPELKERLLACLQIMSNNFQRLMFSRVATADTNAYKSIFLEHLLDELHHDTSLEKERVNKEIKIWDPILESSTSWFLYQNYIVDDPKKVIMVSMVLEKCATKFYSHFSKILSGDLKSEHIENHCDFDPYHESLGLDLIEKQCEYRLDEFMEFLNKSWDIMKLYLQRKGEIVRQSKLSDK